DAVADEDDLGVERALRGLRLVGGDELVEVLERPDRRRPRLGEGDRGVLGIHGDADQWHSLDERAVVAGGLQAVRGELRGDVLHGDVVAARAGTASLKEVAG